MGSGLLISRKEVADYLRQFPENELEENLSEPSRLAVSAGTIQKVFGLGAVNNSEALKWEIPR